MLLQKIVIVRLRGSLIGWLDHCYTNLTGHKNSDFFLKILTVFQNLQNLTFPQNSYSFSKILLFLKNLTFPQKSYFSSKFLLFLKILTFSQNLKILTLFQKSYFSSKF